jgi:hypothetical protein
LVHLEMSLIVTYTSSVGAGYSQSVPIEVGSNTDTESISVGGSSTAGSKSATAGRPIASLLAEEDCWIMIGSAPTAVAGSGRKMLADERLQFQCAVGEKVAVIQA